MGALPTHVAVLAICALIAGCSTAGGDGGVPWHQVRETAGPLPVAYRTALVRDGAAAAVIRPGPGAEESPCPLGCYVAYYTSIREIFRY